MDAKDLQMVTSPVSQKQGGPKSSQAQARHLGSPQPSRPTCFVQIPMLARVPSS